MTAFSGEIHPAAELFPLMGDDDLAALAADIKANGLRQPIVLDGDGKLVDGRNRLRACEIAKVAPEFVSVNGDDPVALVVSLNVKRRNLTASQRAIAAAEACQFLTPGGLSEAERKRLAREFGTNTQYLANARALVERDPDAAAAVKHGPTSLDDAYRAFRSREADLDARSRKAEVLRQRRPDLADRVEAGGVNRSAHRRKPTRLRPQNRQHEALDARRVPLSLRHKRTERGRMTAAEARYHRASRACHRAWLRSQPQYVIPGLLDELDEPHRHQRAVWFVEPAGLTAGAEPCHATPQGPTAVRPRVAPSASPPSGGSAPLSSDGPGALPSKSALRGHWR